MTAQQFLQQGTQPATKGAFRYPNQRTQKAPTVSAVRGLKGARPATMRPLLVPLSTSLVAAQLPAPKRVSNPKKTPVVTATPTTTPAPVVSPTATVAATVIPTKTVTATATATATGLPDPQIPDTLAQTTGARSAFLRSDGSLDVTSSDGTLEVVIPANSLDLSQATLVNGGTPQQPLSLSITEPQGTYTGSSVALGTYQLQVQDSQGQALQQVALLQPMTIKYHYNAQDLSLLQLNPDQIKLIYPALLQQAEQAAPQTASANSASAGIKAAASLASPQTTPATTPVAAFTNDPATSTLTAQTSTLDATPLVVGGSAELQQPAQPLLASVQGNSGMLSYSYPINVAPGVGGFAPKLALTYSSASTNERHNPRDPTGDAGEGWSLTLGAITAQSYPSTSAEQPPSG